MSSRGTQISTPQYSGESLMRWQKLPEEWRIGMLSKRGSLKRPSMTSSKRVSLHDGLTQSPPLKKPHQGIKKTKEKSTLTCPAKMGNDTPPNGSSEWMGGRWPDTLRMMHQEISHSSPTSLPPKNTTTTTTTTLWEPCQGGSCPSWWEVGPPLPQSAMCSTNSPATIGVLWPKSTNIRPWTNSAKCCVPKSTSLNRRSKWPEWNGALVKGGSKQHGQIDKSAIYDWVKQGPGLNKTGSGRTWDGRTNGLAMDMDIHSDREGGVTGLGCQDHCMTSMLL